MIRRVHVSEHTRNPPISAAYVERHLELIQFAKRQRREQDRQRLEELQALEAKEAAE